MKKTVKPGVAVLKNINKIDKVPFEDRLEKTEIKNESEGKILILQK